MSPTQLHLRTHHSVHFFTREKLRFDTDRNKVFAYNQDYPMDWQTQLLEYWVHSS
jgi:hypothetical protein